MKRSEKAKAGPRFNTLRPDDKGRPDDIAVSCDAVHIERMDTGAWWIGIYRKGRRSTFWASSKRAIELELIENDLGLSDDRESGQRQRKGSNGH